MDAVLLNATPEKQENIALVVLKNGRLTDEDTGIKLLDRPVTKKMEDESDESSDDKPDFIELNNATKKETKQVQLDNEPSKVIGPDEDEYQFEN